MSDAPAVIVDGLRKSFDDIVAVDGVTFDVAAGESFGFLGPNGAGKSTTINILCTLLRPTGGSASVAGFDVATRPADVRRHIGLVFQDPTLDEYLTAEENLRFHAELYGVPRETTEDRLRDVLEMVELWERRKGIVATFSGGMRRRLEIARGLLHSPRVLFLDEPTVGLDPQTRAHIWSYIEELRKREEITIFLTTHYMDEAEHCDRIAIIDHGTIVAIDTPEALKASVGEDRMELRTADDEIAMRELRESFGLEPTTAEGAIRVYVANGDRFIPRLFAELTVPIVSVLGDAADARRRVHVVHRPHDPRRRGDGVRADGGQPVHPAADGGAPMSLAQVAPVRVTQGTLADDWRAVKVVWKRELLRFRRNKPRIVTSLAQPILFLFVLGTGLSHLIPGDSGFDFRTFMFPGVISMTILFTAIFSAVSIVWDREFGFLREMLVAPSRRWAIMVGKAAGGSTVATMQGVIILALAGVVHVPYSPILMLTLLGEMALAAFMLTSLGLMLASRIKQVESFQVVMQLFVLPMFFLAGAIFPLTGLPLWLAALTKIDPLAYVITPMRSAVFSHVAIPPDVAAKLNAGVTWDGWRLPSGLALAIVGVVALVLLGVAIVRFSKTE